MKRALTPTLLALLLTGLCLTEEHGGPVPCPGRTAAGASRRLHHPRNLQSSERGAGERTGGLVRLYCEDTFFAGGWKCVTLRLGEDDGYKFVSNLPCDAADVPAA